MKRKLALWQVVSLVVVLALALTAIDWVTGYEINFFVFYFLPVSLGAWALGVGGGVSIAVLCGMLWFIADVLTGHKYPSAFYAVWNSMIRLIAFLAMSWSVSKIKSLLDQERQRAEELRKALAEVKVLEAFLPICAQCKKIRNQEGVWQHLEVYIGQRTGSQFSHGYCSECARKAMEEAGLTNARTAPENPGSGSQPRRT